MSCKDMFCFEAPVLGFGRSVVALFNVARMVGLVSGRVCPSRFTMAWLGVDSAQTLYDSVFDCMRDACRSISTRKEARYK